MEKGNYIVKAFCKNEDSFKRLEAAIPEELKHNLRVTYGDMTNLDDLKLAM